MSSWIFILGHSPALSAEELFIVLQLKQSDVIMISPAALVVRAAINPLELMPRLGGTIKIAELVHTIPRPDAITPDDLLHFLPLDNEQKKIVFGFSLYQVPASSIRVWQTIGLQLKRRLQSLGKQARLVANREGILSSVAVTKNKLLNREFIVVTDGRQTYVGLTRAVQPFAAYSQRDYGRPDRDDERGMLPPKVAQIMINFSQLKVSQSLLDPFCGVGTILQEAALLGFSSLYGSDNDSRAVAMAEKNIHWLQQQRPEVRVQLVTLSAEQLSQHFQPGSIDAVVTEPYLGPARELQRHISLTRLRVLQQELAELYLAVSRQVQTILSPAGTLVMIWPVYFISGEQHYLPILYDLTSLGFSLVTPKIAATALARELSSRGTLVYHRQGQVVGREITVWKKHST
ncbi:MAG: hypothetical protein V1846_01600 [Candidatus Komeilibacteria bacterium]